MKKEPLISILVPVYNISKYINQCLDSLLNQTLKQIEIVCVNDGSTDDSLEKLQKYAETDRRVVIVNKNNGGLPSARNAGLDVAKGKYVGFVDGDDFVKPTMFETLYNEAKKNDADVVVCGAITYPENEKVLKWLTTALSPQTALYKNKGMDIMLNVQGVKPFLWRYLVKRQLIEENHLRLNDAIVLGEDQAFQFKLFSHAKIVKVISDKLYYYRINRNDSIMKNAQDQNIFNKLCMHIDLIEDIVKTVKSSKGNIDLGDFLSWALPFVYWDFIKLCGYDRKVLSKRICKLFLDIGYYKAFEKLSGELRFQYDFIYSQRQNKCNNPKLTLVCVFGNGEDYLEKCLSSILSQEFKDFEVLLFPNGSDEATRKVMWKYLFEDSRISLYNEEWQPISEKYNKAIGNARGEYIQFLNIYDYYETTSSLKEIIEILEKTNTDLIGQKEGYKGIQTIINCQNSSFRDYIYRTNKIRSSKLRFKDYAMLTGSVFFTHYCMNSEKVQFVDRFLFKSKHFKRIAIYAEEADLLLEAFLELLTIGTSNGYSEMCQRITDCLNSENYIRLITDAIWNVVPKNSSDIEKIINFHYSLYKKMLEINDLVSMHELDSAVLKIITKYIEKRHLLLESV